MPLGSAELGSWRRVSPLLAGALALAVVLGQWQSRPAFAWSANGPLVPNGSANGSGTVTTVSGTNSSLQISIQGAAPTATYLVYSCLAITGGDFDCVGRNNPPSLTPIFVSPKALAPLTLGLVQQGTLQTDSNGNGSATLLLSPLLIPDTPHSIYNVVQLVNQGDLTDSYTSVDLQAPTQPIAGVSTLPGITVALVIGVPVYVLAPFPGYAFPIAITTLMGSPFVPSLVIPPAFITGPIPSFTVGVCPNGLPPHAQPVFGGQIIFIC